MVRWVDGVMNGWMDEKQVVDDTDYLINEGSMNIKIKWIID